MDKRNFWNLGKKRNSKVESSDQESNPEPPSQSSGRRRFLIRNAIAKHIIRSTTVESRIDASSRNDRTLTDATYQMSTSNEPWSPPSAVSPPSILAPHATTFPVIKSHLGRYIYSEIALSAGSQAIRLVRIEPGRQDENLLCAIIHTTVAQATNAYEALSYVWGDLNVTEDITIKHGSDEARLSITTSCASALRYLRYSDRPVHVWVDAICINQQDTLERNAQIKLMGRIYSRANQVTVFLGEKSEDSDLIMDYLAMFSVEMAVRGNKDDKKSLGLQEQTALRNLLHRPWFTRIWILQEVFLANDGINVVCGDRWVEWNTLEYFKNEYEREQNNNNSFPSLSTPFLSWPFIFSLVSRSALSAQEQLFEILINTRNSGATDPRDKVFALFNLFTDTEKYGLVADYNLDVASVYIGIAEFLLTKNCGCLAAVQHPSPMKSLPSWVVDWSQSESIKPLHSSLKSFQAGGTRDKARLPIIRRSSDHARILDVSGFIVGTIDDVAEYLPNFAHDFDDWSFGSTLEIWDNCCANQKSSHPRPFGSDEETASSQHHPFLHWMTKLYSHPISKRYAQNLQMSSHSIASENDQASSLKTSDFPYYDLHAAIHIREPLQKVRHHLADFVRWRLSTTNAMRGRCLVMTHNGYFGLAPPTVREKDLICIIIGEPVPFVLRRAGNGNFKLVGECCINGIMNGEALDEVDKSRDASKGGTTDAAFTTRVFNIV